MSQRVASTTFARSSVHYASLHNTQLAKAQKQISSGLQFELPSDEPIAFRQVRSLQTRFTQLQADRTALTRATSTLNASVAQIQDLTELISVAKTVIQRGVQALDTDEREALAAEIDGLLGQAKLIGSASFNNNYLFGGTRSDQPPFQFSTSTAGSGLQAIYQGATQRSQAHIGDSISIDTYYSGQEIFGAPGRGEGLLLGTTGAKLAIGTPTLTGRAPLEVQHTLTTYSGGSGIQAGSGSAGGDTVLGASGTHTITINDTSGDGSAGTISLNGGPEVAYTNGDTNLEVEGLPGQVVYVDTTNISAGFSGTIDLEASGTLSVDGGDTTIPIDFSASQRVVEASTGRFVDIDSRSIAVAGDESLEFPGSSNLFELLHATAADLRNERGLEPTQIADSLSRRFNELDEISQQVFSVMGEQSTSLQTMQTMENRVADLMLSTEISISEIQVTDFPDAVLRLENSQVMLQYTYAVTASLSQLSLLDFLR